MLQGLFIAVLEKNQVMKMHISMPRDAEKMIKVLQQNGHEAYIVGGCVRDALLGKTPHDWDITTSAEPVEVKRLFGRTIDTGIQHGTVTVMMGKQGYEVTTYRLDGKYEDHRRPAEVLFTKSLKEDLLRRDFTINAMAYNDREGLVDLYGGMEDLQNRVIRCVGTAEHRFDEDALRILRAVRFAAQLDFTIEENTRRAMEAKREFLREVSAERIQAELTKLLVSDCPGKLMEAYALGVTKVVLPEFDAMIEVTQENPHHCYNVGAHALAATGCIDNDPALRWAALLHDIGKLETKQMGADGVAHFYGHGEKGVPLAKKVLQRLKLDNQTIKRVLRLVEWHDYGRDGMVNKSAFKRALNRMGGMDCFPDFAAIRYADTYAQSEYRREEKLAAIRHMEGLYREILNAADCMTVRELKIGGNDLKEMGVAPGRQMGAILNTLLDEVLEEPEKNNKDYLSERARVLMEKEALYFN